MPAWLSQISAFTIFLSIAGVGFVFLLISLIFGEIFEHFDGAFDHDFDHGLEHGGPGILSTRVLSVFVTAFGGFGAVATHYGLAPAPASGVGFASGVLFASMIYAFARFLWGQQATSETRVSDLVGQTARVVVGIPGDGVGQVRCCIAEQLIDKIARSQDGAAVPENAVVTIQQVLGETVVVARVSAAAQQGGTEAPRT
jgi:membrane protein implicated in regulation of membrane protease activity